jgi:hypothetical protein
MIALVRDGGRLPWKALAMALGVWVFCDSSARADGDGLCPTCHKDHAGARGPCGGTLGYGPPGVYPGFQGFGLGYHLGYGYGGDALGVGAFGGYPFYGGPGYPHPWPRLRRLGRINPFPYFGGPGYPTPECPNFYGNVGPLVPDRPVITIGKPSDYVDGYGPATGVLPYPESFFAPFTVRAAIEGSSATVSPPDGNSGYTPAPGAMPDGASMGRSLGIDAAPVADAGGQRRLRIAKVYPGSIAEKAGLHAGDVIRTINGYLPDRPGNLTWIIAHAAPDKVLTMTVRNASDGQERTVKAQLR